MRSFLLVSPLLTTRKEYADRLQLSIYILYGVRELFGHCWILRLAVDKIFVTNDLVKIISGNKNYELSVLLLGASRCISAYLR